MADDGPPEPGSGDANAEAFASKFGAHDLQAAFEASAHPMLIADDHRRWVTGNTAACKLLRVAREDLPWGTMNDLAPLSERASLDAQWRAFLAKGAAEGRYQLCVPDRKPVSVEFSAIANVLPGRHLLVFIPPDRDSTAQPEGLLAETAWVAVEAQATSRPQLTQREREVLTLAASGLRTDDIAERLFLSPQTVKTHIHKAMATLGSHTRAHAVAIALVAGQINWDLSPPMPSGDQPPSS